MNITKIHEMTRLNRFWFFLRLGLVGLVGGLISGCFTIILLLFGAGFVSSFSSFLLSYFLYFYHQKINDTRDWFIWHSINRGGVKKTGMRINKRTRFGARDGVFCVCVFVMFL